MISIIKYCKDFNLHPEWLFDYVYDDDLVIGYSNNHFLVIREKIHSPTKKTAVLLGRFDSYGLLNRYLESYYGLQKK